jgi:hypothetical protein
MKAFQLCVFHRLYFDFAVLLDHIRLLAAMALSTMPARAKADRGADVQFLMSATDNWLGARKTRDLMSLLKDLCHTPPIHLTSVPHRIRTLTSRS